MDPQLNENVFMELAPAEFPIHILPTTKVPQLTFYKRYQDKYHRVVKMSTFE